MYLALNFFIQLHCTGHNAKLKFSAQKISWRVLSQYKTFMHMVNTQLML